jgi:eukaryotic-like serine/threonine-protein kinase
MPVVVGTRLGAYEIVGVLGAGGMGEVYSARDTRLRREVAIKVLPDRFASDPERIARFQREAQVLASLNDPHIGALYGLEESQGTLALVLELVEGQTLADRLASGALPIDETLVIARQMTLAIEAAHDKGIIHRDLKPSNVKVRADGTVKILDFGLAKLLDTDRPSSSLTMSPTLSVEATDAGMILGTAAYMSPEQARGKPVDRRTDIWAFGCVLYEMLSGKQPFAAGETVSDAIAAIIRSEPDWGALPASTPEPIGKLLRRCLAKDPGDRLHDIADARLEISDALTAGAPRGPKTAVAPRRMRDVIIWIGVAATLAAAIVAGITSRNIPADTRIYRSEIVPPATLQWDPSGRFALSPDGRRLAFLAPGADGRRLLWVRSLDSISAQSLAGTDDAT